MKKPIACFLPMANVNDLRATVDVLKQEKRISDIYVFTTGEASAIPEGLIPIEVPGFNSTVMVKEMALHSKKTEYVLLYTRSAPLQLGAFALSRMIQVAKDTQAGMVYSDYYSLIQGRLRPHPVIDYQEGSLRDDFNFGSLMLFDSTALHNAAEKMKTAYRYAGLYDLRLKIAQKDRLWHLPELLYVETESDTRRTGEKIFDYVDPKNRAVQLEMEAACIQYLKEQNAWLRPQFKEVPFDQETFPVEATVVIPVRDRVKTIEDAVRSVFCQQTDFDFNLIVVDNHSTDGTTERLTRLAREDNRLLHVVPQREDLQIGGCWNEAVRHPACGKFVIQLDSDDLYANEEVLQTVVEAFYQQKCAMVVGAYRMVNFNLEEIPPGVIDHSEWTPDNGRNNALRINGLGAPRAFYTGVLRDYLFPNVSYGEDYAIGLSLSRHYRIGRVYKPLYLCRRWEENSDASLDVVGMNRHNFYKDRLRTMELWARKELNKQQGLPMK